MPDLPHYARDASRGGARGLYRGDLGTRIVDHVLENGRVVDAARPRGVPRHLAPADSHDLRGHELFVSNPPPSSGGVLIGYALALLDRLDVSGPAGSAESIQSLVEVMREATAHGRAASPATSIAAAWRVACLRTNRFGRR